MTVLSVALSDTAEEHLKMVKAWAGMVWAAWSQYHAEVTSVVSDHLTLVLHHDDSDKSG